jgi:ceramide glucosyltransferase
LLAGVSGWSVVRDPRSLAYCWLYPLREFLGFCLWCFSFLGRTIVWRGERYQLYPGGRMGRAVRGTS